MVRGMINPSIMAKKSIESLLNNIIGQLKGVRGMVEAKQGCADIIIQLKAARSALNSLIIKYFEANLEECVSDSGKIINKAKFNKLVEEIMKK